MRISVVIPAHNAAATIGETLASILAQLRPADEIVVVDDGSDDATGEIVDRMAPSWPALRLARQATAGPAAARNRAIAMTSGDLIAPIDADDLWHPEYLAEMSTALAADRDAGFAYALHDRIGFDGRRLGPGLDTGITGRAFARHLLVNMVGNGSSAVFRRGALLEAGGYSEAMMAQGGGEDYLLQLAIAARHRIICVDHVLVSYRKHPASWSSDPARSHRARIGAVDTAIERFGSPHPAIRRWVAADAARVRAVQHLSRREIGDALFWAVQALRDPAATLTEGAARIANALRRAAGISPPPVARPDRLMRYRLRRLAVCDARAGLAGRAGNEACSSWKPGGEAIGQTERSQPSQRPIA